MEKRAKIQLSDHFTFGKLFRFVIPSIITMIFTSIYGVVDGICVSNFAGPTAFASVNLIMPFIMIFSCFGFMVGTGGSALIGKLLGEGKSKKANEVFSMLVVILVFAGIAIAIIQAVFMRKVALAFGATPDMIDSCVTYGRLSTISITAFILQYFFQSLFITAEKPKMGLFITLLSGGTNIVLDIVLVGVFKYGVAGAAIATVISEFIGGLIPIAYFLSHKNTSRLHLYKFTFDLRAFLKVSFNGASELLTNISMSIVNMAYNWQLMRMLGADGVAAYGVVMYVNFIFSAAYLGYSLGTAPLVSFNYGAQNHSELKNIFRKSLIIISMLSIAIAILAELIARPLSGIFVGYDEALLDITTKAFMIYSVSYLFNGFNIYGSSFFTALNNGLVSGMISSLRVLVFQLICVFVLPILLGPNAIWGSIIVAEGLALCVTIFCLIKFRKRYKYI